MKPISRKRPFRFGLYFSFTRKTSHFILFLLHGVALSQCGGSGTASSATGSGKTMHMVLQVEMDALLRNLAGSNADARFEEGLQKAVGQLTPESAPLHELLYFALKEADDGEEAQLAQYFANRRSGLNPWATDEEVLRYLDEQSHDALEHTFTILRHRIDKLKFAQPNTQLNKRKAQIILDVPGVEDPERLKSVIGKPGNLGFWETHSYQEVYPVLERINKVVQRLTGADTIVSTPAEEPQSEVDSSPKSDLEAIFEAAENEGTDVDPGPVYSEEQFRRENPFLGKFNLKFGMDPRRPLVGTAALKDTAAINGWLRHPDVRAVIPVDVKLLWEFSPAIDNPEGPDAPPLLGLIAIRTNRDDQPPLDGSYITDARQDFEMNTSAAMVSLNMNSAGAKMWARLTKSNVNRCIAIVLDDRVYTYPNVMGQITGGRSQVTGNFTVEEARDLATILNSGALPTSVRIIEATEM